MDMFAGYYLTPQISQIRTRQAALAWLRKVCGVDSARWRFPRKRPGPGAPSTIKGATPHPTCLHAQLARRMVHNMISTCARGYHSLEGCSHRINTRGFTRQIVLGDRLSGRGLIQNPLSGSLNLPRWKASDGGRHKV